MPLSPEYLPGNYLYRSRLGSGRALAGYCWIEVAPIAMALGLADVRLAALFILCHWAFLGLYECGYVLNDRAPTASERPDRTSAQVVDAMAFTASRATLFVVAAVTAGRVAGSFEWTYVGAACVTLVLLAIHTQVGARLPACYPVRSITFAWLAFVKYAPALLAVMRPSVAASWCIFMFVCYGAGRVLEYTISKSGASPASGVLDISTGWFLASMPAAIAVLLSGVVPVLPGSAALLVIGSYHAAALAMRFWTSRRCDRPSKA